MALCYLPLNLPREFDQTFLINEYYPFSDYFQQKKTISSWRIATKKEKPKSCWRIVVILELNEN